MGIYATWLPPSCGMHLKIYFTLSPLICEKTSCLPATAWPVWFRSWTNGASEHESPGWIYREAIAAVDPPARLPLPLAGLHRELNFRGSRGMRRCFYNHRGNEIRGFFNKFIFLVAVILMFSAGESLVSAFISRLPCTLIAKIRRWGRGEEFVSALCLVQCVH